MMCINATKNLAMTDKKKIEYQQCTQIDPKLQIIKTWVLNGWPDNKINTTNEAKKFF